MLDHNNITLAHGGNGATSRDADLMVALITGDRNRPVSLTAS